MEKRNKKWKKKPGKKEAACIIGGFLVFAAVSWQSMESSTLKKGYLERNGYGQESKTYEFLVSGIEKGEIPCAVEIPSLQYSSSQADQVFDQLIQRLSVDILGENSSLTEIRTDLNLVEWFDEAGVRVKWHSEQEEVIDSYGCIHGENIPESGISVQLTAVLTDGVHKKETVFDLHVLPAAETKAEIAARNLAEQIRQNSFDDLTSRTVQLPREYEGQAITYREADSEDYRFLPFIGIILAVLFYAYDCKQEENVRKQRRRMLQMDYADVVYQLMVYTGAGLTVGTAWGRIVENYRHSLKRVSVRRPVYEEMAVTWNQIQCGVSEGKALSEFGKRCELQCYLKLSSLLEQNRKTGTKNLSQLLEREMAEAWEQQKNLAKRMGEEAGTKLMAPLFMMLLVVMTVIMVPAIVSIQ